MREANIHPIHRAGSSSLLDLVSVARQEVELDGGEQADYYHDHNRVNGTRWADNQTTAGSKWDIPLGFIGEDRQREVGECGQIDQQAGANDKPHTEAAETIFA